MYTNPYVAKYQDAVAVGRSIGASDNQIKEQLLKEASQNRILANGRTKMSEGYYDAMEMCSAALEVAKTLG